MCLKPQPPCPMPEATAALVYDLFPDGSVYQFIGDVLFDQFHDNNRLFGISRGKRMFFGITLAHQKAMYQKFVMADSAKKRRELICAVLMRNNEFVNHGKS